MDTCRQVNLTWRGENVGARLCELAGAFLSPKDEGFSEKWAGSVDCERCIGKDKIMKRVDRAESNMHDESGSSLTPNCFLVS